MQFYAIEIARYVFCLLDFVTSAFFYFELC